jgi:uncharacterized protein YcbK (DUF882 family)
MKPSDKLTDHFRLAEFLRGGSMEGVTPDVIENLRSLAQKLEGVRELFDAPVIINSGFRTKKHNAAVGGEKNSFHMRGMAADIVVKGVPAHEVQAKLKDWPGGLGSYSKFTHLDIRPYRARWSGK